MQKLNRTLHVASSDEWLLDYETQGKLRQYYSNTQRRLYEEKYLNPLTSFMSTFK
jgi:hypothetical protein